MSQDNIKKYKSAYAVQKSNAKRRGIEWRLTFDEWLNWWGSDIERRGVGRESLQMQRYGDSGPYELGNIKKGVPRQNVATWVNVAKGRRASKAKRDHEAFLDALMWEPSKPEKDDYWIPDDVYHDPKMNGVFKKTAFHIDKDR